MPAPLDPPELDRLVDFAERPRTGDWSLRAALVRYAGSNPRRVSEVLELVRRIDAALRAHSRLLARRGPEVWRAVQGEGAAASDEEAAVVALLQVTAELDQLADRLAAWAADRTADRPDGEVDAVVASVARRLDELGISREEPPRAPPGARRRG